MAEFAVITAFPEMFSAFSEYGVCGRAIRRGDVVMQLVSPRDYAGDVHQTIDERPFGGGPGMVMCYTPLAKAVRAAKKALGASAKVVYLSPQGQKLTHRVVQDLGGTSCSFVLVCGRYEGVDERFIQDYVDVELSIGDYVLSGGELAAMVVMDALMRTLPGVIGKTASVAEDSFVNGLLDCPHYTRPAHIPEGSSVPDVLRSGDHARIARWRRKQALGRTWFRRPELLNSQCLSEKDKALLGEYIEEIQTGTQGKGEDSEE